LDLFDMNPDVILIAQPAIDFRVFVALSHKLLGRNIADAVDATRRELSEAEKFVSCLAAMRDVKAKAGLPPCLLSHVSFSAFIGADDRDLLDILQCCAGMPFVTAETPVRGIQIAVVTGTLAQWKDAIASGCRRDVEPPVRACFNKLYGLFTAAGLNVWGDFQTRSISDQTFLLLDDKRGK
jgi:hypothetical protein